MSIIYLKKGIDETQRINDDDKVKKIVETTQTNQKRRR